MTTKPNMFTGNRFLPANLRQLTRIEDQLDRLDSVNDDGSLLGLLDQSSLIIYPSIRADLREFAGKMR